MPAAVVAPAAIAAAGQVAGGIMGSRSANRASQDQRASQQEALQFERDRAAKEDQRYAEQMARFQEMMDAYNANRGILAQRYGLSVPGGAGGMKQRMMPQGNTLPGGPPAAQGVSLGSMIGGGAPQPPPDLEGVWNPYGL